MTDFSRIHEVANGLGIYDQSGNVKHTVFGGSDSPVADTTAPKGSVYHRDNGEVWFRFESGWGIITTPVYSEKPEYLSDGEVDKVTFYNSSTQDESNRIADVQIAYDGNLNPISETWKFYSPSDGTTIIQTSVLTNTFTGVDLTKTTRSDS